MNGETNKEMVNQAKEKARSTFNSLPFETRKLLANGFDRLLEIEALLSKGESLCVAMVRKRKKELEKWLLDWYREQ